MFVIPVERHETVARADPVADNRGQHRPAAAGAELDRLALGDVECDGIDGMHLDERPAVELVELVDLAGLGHGVPLVLQPSGVEHDRIVGVGQFVGINVRPREEHRTPRGSGERKPWLMSVLVDEEVLADTVIEVTDRMPVVVAPGHTVRRHRPLQRCRT